MKKAILILLAGASLLAAVPAAQAYSPTRKKTLITALTALSFIGYSTYYLYGTHEAPALNQYSLNDAAKIVDEEWGRAIDTMYLVNEKIDAASFAQNLNKSLKAAEYYLEAAQLTEDIADTYRNSIERMLLLQLDEEQTLGENKDFREALLMACAIACKSYDSAAQMYLSANKLLMAKKMKQTKECIHRPGQHHESTLSPKELREDLLKKINQSRIHNYADIAEREKAQPIQGFNAASAQKVEKFNLDSHELQKDNTLDRLRDHF